METSSARTVSQVLQRQLTMLTLVPRFPETIGTPELREQLRSVGFETTARTIQRDLQALATYFAIECRSEEKPYGWGWREGAAALDLPMRDHGMASNARAIATAPGSGTPSSASAGT